LGELVRLRILALDHCRRAVIDLEMIVKYRHLVILFALTTALLASCTAAGPEPTPTQAPPPITPPFPTAVPGVTLGPKVSSTPMPPATSVRSTTSVATSLNPGWTRYACINDMAFAPDGTLWAMTRAGLVHWDLTTETYTRYLIEARDIAVAAGGTLWLAMDHGLCHFTVDSAGDAKCDNYTTDDGLIHDEVRAVAVAADGSVWVGTGAGVSRFDGATWQSYPSPASTEDLAVAVDGEVWHATATGIGRYSPSQDTWTTYAEAQGFPNPHATVVAAGRGGEVWTYIQWDGLYRFDGESWHAVEEVPGGIVGDIAMAADGTPWVGTVGSTHYPGGSLVYRAGDTWVDVTADAGLTSIGSLATGPGGVVAADTSLGLGVYREGEWRLLKDGPTSNRVTSIAVTPDGAAWFAFGDQSVATTGGGLSRYDGHAWGYELGDADVQTLAVAPDGSLWAGRMNGLWRYDGQAWKEVRECENAVDCGVWDIAFSVDGAVWVANGFSVSRYTDPALSVSTDGTGNGQSWTRYDKLVHSMVAAPDGSIWMNGWEGSQGSNYVARVEGDEWTTYKTADSFPGAFTVGVVTDDGCAWGVVPERGLACFTGGDWTDGQSWTFYRPPEGISLLSLSAMAPDGALWLVAEDGVVRFEPTAGLAGGGESITYDAWTLYTREDGLGSNYHAIAFGPDGEIWFGTTRFQRAQAASSAEGMTATPYPSTPTPTPYTGPIPTPPPTPTPEIDPACKEEWDRASSEVAQDWERVIAAVNIEALYHSSASVMGECIRSDAGTAFFQPTQTWFYVSKSTSRPDVDQVGDSFAAFLDVLFANYGEDDLPGSEGIIYGTLSIAYTDDAGWPAQWEHFLWLPFEEAQATHSQGLGGKALLEALRIVTPSQ
jgi:hypothetical protein